MRARTLLAAGAATALVLASVRSGHSMGTKPEPPPSAPSSSPSVPGGTDASAQAANPARQEAERKYALAYDDLAKAKKDADSGNKKNAEKKFRKVLERVQDAVALDSTYAEAWNLVGYASRKLGDYDKAFAAYDRCLTLKPDLLAAREYLGEAYLEKGQLDKSREQLSILVKANAEGEEAKALNEAITAYVAAHPDAAKAQAAPAATDSASTQTGVK
jgi:tetratricopeptide (TPR) repeat protein